jgi:hypothetical protein
MGIHLNGATPDSLLLAATPPWYPLHALRQPRTTAKVAIGRVLSAVAKKQDMSNQASQSLTVTLSEPLPRYSRLSLCYLPVPVRASFQYQTMPTTIMSKGALSFNHPASLRSLYFPSRSLSRIRFRSSILGIPSLRR